MSTLSEFLEERVPRAGARAPSRAQSTSPGPVVVLKEWREGMNKVAVTTLLHKNGVPLAEAHEATETVLRGQSVTVYLRHGSNLDNIRQQLGSLGIVL
jgi:hypothetical protein